MLRYESPTGDKHRYTASKVLDPNEAFFLSSIRRVYSNISSLDASHFVRDGILESSACGIARNSSDFTRFHRHPKQSSESHHSRTTRSFLVPIYSSSPQFYIETQQLHACTRLHCISSPYLGCLASGGGPDTDYCWLPAQE